MNPGIWSYTLENLSNGDIARGGYIVEKIKRRIYATELFSTTQPYNFAKKYY